MIRSVRIHEFGGPEVLRIEEVEVEELQSVLGVHHHVAGAEKPILEIAAQVSRAAERRQRVERHPPRLGIQILPA